MKRSIRALEEEEIAITPIHARTGFHNDALYKTALQEFAQTEQRLGEFIVDKTSAAMKM